MRYNKAWVCGDISGLFAYAVGMYMHQDCCKTAGTYYAFHLSAIYPVNLLI